MKDYIEKYILPYDTKENQISYLEGELEYDREYVKEHRRTNMFSFNKEEAIAITLLKTNVLMDSSDQDLREELKLRGYYVDNLWSLHDISDKYKVSVDQGQEILDKAMTSEYIVGEIFQSIEDIANNYKIN
jgi:hypothetical protein|tara:strand:+ start:1007 stop:1399 length:393 start_codon:yes stop_codon:yes gene_type:complete